MKKLIKESIKDLLFNELKRKMMFPMKHITLEQLNRYKEKLVAFSNITEENIRSIWIKDGEDPNVDLTTIEYNWDIPLYQKMIFRFRNCNKSAPAFFRQIDPGNQQRMLWFFILFGLRDNEIIEFFAWIANGLGVYNITKLEFDDYNEQLVTQSTLVPKWRENQITFFFDLDEDKKANLIKEYNKDCVDKYNEIGDRLL